MSELNKFQYLKLIREDIEWIKSVDDNSLETQHIKCVLEDSVHQIYDLETYTESQMQALLMRQREACADAYQTGARE